MERRCWFRFKRNDSGSLTCTSLRYSGLNLAMLPMYVKMYQNRNNFEHLPFDCGVADLEMRSTSNEQSHGCSSWCTRLLCSHAVPVLTLPDSTVWPLFCYFLGGNKFWFARNFFLIYRIQCYTIVNIILDELK